MKLRDDVFRRREEIVNQVAQTREMRQNSMIIIKVDLSVEEVFINFDVAMTMETAVQVYM